MPAPDRHTAESIKHPETRAELRTWISTQLHLEPSQETALVAAIDCVLTRQERLWQASKADAIQAMSTGFAARLSRLNAELLAKDTTVSHISAYFERLVAELTDRTRRDPKTELMNFSRFVEQLESFLAVEQRVRWAAVGLVDVSGFKWYNDRLGHAMGDRVIRRVAEVLRREVRSNDLLAQEQPDARDEDLHARLGGDEFCFLIPNLAEAPQAGAIAERFRRAIEDFDWAREDPRLVERPVKVDVGVVCLWLGPLAQRRHHAGEIASALIDAADQLMYAAKSSGQRQVALRNVRLVDGQLAPASEPVSP